MLSAPRLRPIIIICTTATYSKLGIQREREIRNYNVSLKNQIICSAIQHTDTPKDLETICLAEIPVLSHSVVQLATFKTDLTPLEH